MHPYNIFLQPPFESIPEKFIEYEPAVKLLLFFFFYRSLDATIGFLYRYNVNMDVLRSIVKFFFIAHTSIIRHI